MQRPTWLSDLYSRVSAEPVVGQIRLPQQANGMRNGARALAFVNAATSLRELVWSAKQDLLDDLVVEWCSLQGLEDSTGKNRVKWLLRLYSLRRALFRYLHLRRVGIEHGLYGNLDGDVEVSDFVIERCASQAIQLCWRPTETVRPETATTAKAVRIFRGLIRNCGRPGWAYKVGSSRPASALSVFRLAEQPLSMVDVQDVHMQSSQEPFGKQGWRSFGAMLFQEHQNARVANCSVDYEPPSDRPVLIFERCRSVELDGVAVLNEGKVDIIGAETVRVSGCYGPARVRIDGQDVGELGSLSIGGAA